MEVDKGRVARSYDATALHTEDSHLNIWISPGPQANYRMLSFGPFLPVIPWIPGIVTTITHRKEDEIPHEQLTVYVEFTGDQKHGASSCAFSPRDVSLTTENKIFHPAASKYNYCPPGSTCNEDSNGRFAIMISTNPFSGVRTELVFDLYASELKESKLEIGHVVCDGIEYDVPKIDIKRYRGFYSFTVP